MIRSAFAVVALLASSALALADTGDTVLATAPSGEFSLVMGEQGGPILVVPARNPEIRAKLPPVRVTAHQEGDWSAGLREFSSDDVGDPTLTFISPDSAWIFVQMKIESEFGIGFLYHRAGDANADGAPAYQLAAPERFDMLAWRFFCAENGIDEKQVGVEDSFGNRVMSVTFGGWSADSGRLLVALNGGLGARKEPMGEFPKMVRGWLCYYNAQTGAFELTDWLRAANKGALRAEGGVDPGSDASIEVLYPEEIGREGPQPPIKARFEKADRELNDVYAKVLAQTSPAAKAQLQEEQRAWLKQRELFAKVHELQSWSLFPSASYVEGQAIATEARIAELSARRR